MINMATLLLLLLAFILANAYDREPHKLEISSEKFKMGDYYFIFYSKEANWAEAYTICQATHSRLAVVNTPDRAKFLAEVLSQTKVGFEDVWIGGRYSRTSNMWQWAPTSKSIPAPAEGFPPWLNYPTIKGKNCLALDRRNHWHPLFVELKCHLYRSFVCEESVGGINDKFPIEGNQIAVNNRRYILYHGRVTWDEALAFCKQAEAQLATIPDLDTATKLVETMKRSRPPFEDVWIGAKRDYLDWKWVATDKSLANQTGSNGFPPWRFDQPVDPSKTCVLLDHHVCLDPYHSIVKYLRHVCEEPVFIEESCQLKRDFLCEIPQDEEREQIKPSLVTVNQVTYIFYEEPLSWEDAKITCEAINMTLAIPETDGQWQTLATHMGDMQHALYHVWLGGKSIGNEWVWLNNHSVPLPNPKNTYPPWCTSIDLHEIGLDCINLDRDAHNVALIYGFNCSIKQPFVCQLEGDEFINTHGGNTDDLEYGYHTDLLTHFEAEWECQTNHSHLATANNIDLAQEIALLIPRDTLVWIGARRIDTQWRWLKTREVIPDTQNDERYPPWASLDISVGQAQCLAIKAGYRVVPQFVERPCKEKLNYLCQFDKKEPPQSDMALDVNGIKFYFYKKGLPWQEALSVCHSGGLFLVNVGNLELASMLTDSMTDSIPLWTSGKQITPGSWTWITTGSKLPSQIKLDYPPWLNKVVPNDTEHPCLQLDMVEEFPTFSAEDCLQNRSFVCSDKTTVYNETELEIDNLNVSIKDVMTTIAKAKKACLDSGKEVVDFSKLDNEKLLSLLKNEKVKSLWVDVVHNSAGKWVYADTDEEFQTEINFPARHNQSVNAPERCLTLSVTPENNLILLPALCSDFSSILCMTVNKSDPAPRRVELVVNETTTLIAILDNSTAEYSVLACNDLGGESIGEDMEDKAIEFFKTLHPDYKKFWFGATYGNNVWTLRNGKIAHEDGLPEPSVMKDLNQTNHENMYCVAYDRELDGLSAEKCSNKFSTVCQKVQNILVTGGVCKPKPEHQDSVQWPEKCTKGPVNSGTVCRAKCPPNVNLVGSEFHVCSQGKWSQTIEPRCENDKNLGRLLVELTESKIRKELSQTSFLFVLDTGLTKSDFGTTVQMARNLANTLILSNQRRVTMELYSSTAKIVDLFENNNCYLIRTVDKLAKVPHVLTNSLPNYSEAFLAAEQELTLREVERGTGFIFFFAMRPDAGSMNRTKVVKQMKEKGITFVVITVGDDINRSLLEEIASTRYGALQLYTFDTMKGMRDANNYLKTKQKVHKRDCTP